MGARGRLGHLIEPQKLPGRWAQGQVDEWPRGHGGTFYFPCMAQIIIAWHLQNHHLHCTCTLCHNYSIAWSRLKRRQSSVDELPIHTIYISQPAFTLLFLCPSQLIWCRHHQVVGLCCPQHLVDASSPPSLSPQPTILPFPPSHPALIVTSQVAYSHFQSHASVPYHSMISSRMTR